MCADCFGCQVIWWRSHQSWQSGQTGWRVTHRVYQSSWCAQNSAGALYGWWVGPRGDRLCVRLIVVLYDRCVTLLTPEILCLLSHAKSMGAISNQHETDFLQMAGILNKNGDLAKPYRSWWTTLFMSTNPVVFNSTWPAKNFALCAWAGPFCWLWQHHRCNAVIDSFLLLNTISRDA